MQQPRRLVRALQQNIAQVVVGKDDVIELALIALLCKGHILIEDVPGVGKTTLASALAKSLDCSFKRIQFTPDVTPSDVTGFSIVNFKTSELEYKPGAVMSQIVLADEINRTSPKTQATQNPVEFVGTYPLPEAQMDRFFMRISIGYPSVEDEMEILERYSAPVSPLSTLQPVCNAEDIIGMQAAVTEIYCSREVRSYVANITASTRRHPALQLGVSTRGAIALIKAAQANALLAGRDFILPEDVQRMALPVLCHRVMLSPEARMQGDTADRIVSDIVNNVQVPVRVK